MYFDSRDTDILQLVNRVLQGRAQTIDVPTDAGLHPHGIKELVDTPAARMAYAVVNLLHNLETGRTQARDRLQGLKILYDEVLNSAHTALRRNTARVLMQIMKGIVRAYGDKEQQLMLVHDFLAAAQGTPRIVRRLLKRYHLPEMSEEWNQLAFDDHVYDMNTRGRKTPTHLIMDAWIKGLRKLIIVYDNCVDHEVAQEVLSAAAIVGINVRIGLEFRVPFRGRLVSFLWCPRGFLSDQDFLDFLLSPKMTSLTAHGREVVSFIRDLVLRNISFWNENLLQSYAEEYGLHIPPLSAEDFQAYIGRGHASRERLAEYMHARLQPLIEERLEELSSRPAEGLTEKEARQKDLLAALNADVIQDEWISPAVHPELPHADFREGAETLPRLMRLSPLELLRELQGVTEGYRMVLCTAGLSVEDVMELLWDTKGIITHLELFTMRGWVDGAHRDINEIGELQRALNTGQGPRLKQMIRQMIRGMHEAGDEQRALKFENILFDVPTLWERYRHAPLMTRLGTGSANRSRSFGMGLVVTDTLPRRSARFLRESQNLESPIPVFAYVEKHSICREPENPGPWETFLKSLRGLPGCANLGKEQTEEWVYSKGEMRVSPKGNIANLGGPVSLNPASERREAGASPGIYYLNSSVSNWIKVLLGFIPSLISFLYTQDWWFLAWFGTFIWFGITGVRNVIQMVLAASGLNRNTMLHWRDQVSISRLCDSLMYTGISVLLLEVFVRVWFLEDLFGLTVVEQPLLVYSVINVVNGFYIFFHNIYRGFPRTAAIGNLFRAFLAIPVAAVYNSFLWECLIWFNVADPAFYLIPSATVISKTASDTVAAVIEGFADSRMNRRIRSLDYRSKLRSVFDAYTHLELMFPREDALVCLARPGGLKGRGGDEARRLERTFIINALDMMYLWYYQPRGQDAFRQMVRTMTSADKTVLALSQLVLMREREVSQLMVDGLVGRNFARALAFFLSKRKEYIKSVVELCKPSRLRAGMPPQRRPRRAGRGFAA